MSKKNQKVVLCILDGWGVCNGVEANGIALANTPHWDRLWSSSAATTLNASELHVGLPVGQMGNSEVGHMSIGSGRVIMQDLPLIDHAIVSDHIPTMSPFKEFVKGALSGTGVVHLMGLLSPGGVHSHQNHLFYMAKLLAGAGLYVKIHAFLDGRDTPPQSAGEYLAELQRQVGAMAHISLATIGGRYYGMDRDQRWDRIQRAYAAIVEAQGPVFTDPEQLLEQSYGAKITDEFIAPHVAEDYTGVAAGDSLLMINFRSDRARQILTALCDPDFKEFARQNNPKFAATLGMMAYSESLSQLVPPLFVKEELAQTLGEIVATAGLKQLRIAETEKYAHVTFFFNGGREVVFSGEERTLIPSPAVATYDLQPEMSAPQLTSALVAAIAAETYDVIVVNYANPDMVGHTGVQAAIIQAVNCIDDCLGQLTDVCRNHGYALMITADHGNVEVMVDNDNHQAHTAHTLNPVPFVLINSDVKTLRTGGDLRDIAPTVLEIIGLDQPEVMTGRSLIVS